MKLLFQLIQPALQLLSARKLHEYELPEGWAVFAAINPETADYHVHSLDRALRSRFLNFRVHADRASWIAWAIAADVHPAVVTLAREHDRIFEQIPPRSWTHVSDVLRAMKPGERANPQIVRDVLAGYLPPTWTQMLLSMPEAPVRPTASTEAPGMPCNRFQSSSSSTGSTACPRICSMTSYP